MNLALLTYFIPAAFLAVPMYKTMGNYGLLNNQWALILAMMTIASPYSIWVLKQASDKLPYELDEAARIDGASPLQLFRLVYLPLMMPSLVAIGTYALLLAWNEYLYAFLLLSNEKQITLGVALGNFLAADDSPWELLMTDRPDLRAAAGGDLLRVQALHGRRPDRRRGEELTTAVPGDNSHGIGIVSRHRKELRQHQGHPRHRLRHQGRRVHGAGRPFGLRQVDAAADAGGARGDHRRHDRDRRQGGQRRRVEGSRHRDGVPELRALSAHDGGRQHGVQPEAAQGRPRRRSRSASRRRRRS